MLAMGGLTFAKYSDESSICSKMCIAMHLNSVCERLSFLVKPTGVFGVHSIAASRFKAPKKAAVAWLVWFCSQSALGWTGISIHSDPKYAPGFSHLEYADPGAVKGGKIVFGSVGTFDTLNAFSAKGLPPLFLQTLVFQSLGQPTLDEPFTQYPDVGAQFKVADDRLSMEVTLDERARFADGRPITSDDVLFSFQLFRSDHVDALYKTYWADIKAVQVIDSRKVRFEFRKINPELAAITTQMMVLPKHFYEGGDFAKDFSDRVLGSGPYVISSFQRGSHVSYRRNPKFWAAKTPFNIGRHNFDEIVVKYYKDPTARTEAFKKGEFDIFPCHTSKVWAKDLRGKKFESLRWIERHEWNHRNNQGGVGFFFNLRRPIFQDIQVRKAIALAFDFSWTNDKLFYGQYKRNTSFFENSPLGATGMPAGPELDLLKSIAEQFPDDVPDDVFKKPMGHLTGEVAIKERLRKAAKLLKAAGYKLENGVMQGEHGPLTFRFLVHSPYMSRIIEPYLKNLRRIGVRGSIKQTEVSVYQRRLQSRDFDVTVLGVPQSQSPGNEQIDFWHSSQADAKYARNHYGLKNRAVDALIDKVIYASDRAQLVIATKSLDRVLYHLHIAVHHWHIAYHRVALWRKFAWPQSFPPYFSPYQWVQFMWHDATLAADLKKARSQRTPLAVDSL